MKSFSFYFPEYFKEKFVDNNTIEIVTAGIKELVLQAKKNEVYLTIKVFDKEKNKLIFLLDNYYCPNVEKVTYKTENGITTIKIVEKESFEIIPVIKEK